MKQGTIHLSTRIRDLPEGRTELPTAIKNAIKAHVGEDNALDVMLLHPWLAFQHRQSHVNAGYRKSWLTGPATPHQ
jgi:hypothetical protein